MAPLSPKIPGLIHRHRYCDNGAYPDAQFYAATQSALNHIVAYKRKPLFQRTVPLGWVGGTTGTAWRFYARTGYGCKRIGVMAVLGLDDRSIAVDPYVSVTLTEVGGAALTALDFHYGASNVIATDAPDEFSVSTRYVACSANTEYTGAVVFNDNVRVVSLLVFEQFATTIDDATDYFSSYAPAGGGPIYDNRIGQQLQAVGNMLRKNGGLRGDWVPVDGTARTRTSATYINLIDNSSATPPTTAPYTPGWTFVTTARNTASATTIPIKMAVYGSRAAGSHHVVLRDTAGADAVDVTINGAAGWYTATGAISVGAGQKYDLMFAGDGANTVTVNAVSFFEVGT